MLAINLLKQEDYKESLAYLEKSQRLAANNELGLAMTYNNLACFYKKRGRFRTALSFLEKALDIEQRFPNNCALANTHLNISAVLSLLNRHDIAINHANQAIIIVQSTLLL